MTEQDYVYVGVASDDRRKPILAETLEAACKQVTEEYGLRVSATDPSNWEKKWGPAKSKIHDRQAWRLTVRSQWWDYASIHRFQNPL